MQSLNERHAGAVSDPISKIEEFACALECMLTQRPQVPTNRSAPGRTE